MTGVIAVIIDSEYRSPANIVKGSMVQGIHSYAIGIIDTSLPALRSLRAVSPRV